MTTITDIDYLQSDFQTGTLTETPQLDSLTVEVSGEFGSFFMFPF